MSDKRKYLHELHQEHLSWSSEIQLASDEIKSFTSRIEEVNAANSAQEIKVQIEHFQNQFIRHQVVIDELLHDIHASEKLIAAIAEANNVATEHKKTEDHTDLRSRMERFRKIFGALKSELNEFLTKTL